MKTPLNKVNTPFWFEKMTIHFTPFLSNGLFFVSAVYEQYVCACVRACVRARACVYACVRVCLDMNWNHNRFTTLFYIHSNEVVLIISKKTILPMQYPCMGAPQSPGHMADNNDMWEISSQYK